MTSRNNHLRAHSTTGSEAPSSTVDYLVEPDQQPAAIVEVMSHMEALAPQMAERG